MIDDISATMSVLNFHHCFPDLTGDLKFQAREGPMDESILCAWLLGRKLIRMPAEMIYGTVSLLYLISFQPFTPLTATSLKVSNGNSLPSLIDC